MDLSNLITASNYTLPENGISNPVLNKITEVTGHQWKMYLPSTDFMSTFYPTMRDFFFHNWIGLIVVILMLIVLGEILFYRSIKKEKVQYIESNNSFVLKHKTLSYLLSFIILCFAYVFIPGIIIMVSFFILNSLLFIVTILSVAVHTIILGLILILGIKIIVRINKAVFGHLIKKETEEEYEARQSTYKFRDGTIVKIKPNIVEDVTVIDNHKATPRLERMSKAGKIYIIKNHNSKGKVNLRDAEDNHTGTSRYEYWIEEASEEEKLKFLKENAEYKIKEVEKSKGNTYRLGTYHSKETLEKLRESHLGQPCFWKGKKMLRETKDKISKAKIGVPQPQIQKDKIKAIWNQPEYKQFAKDRRAKQTFPVRDTKIEVKIQDYLKQLNIPFESHKYLGIKYNYPTDIFVPSLNLVIECDGDYWHGNTKLYDFRKMSQSIKQQIPLDFERTTQLEEKGFKVLRLWENEINRLSLDEFNKKLMEFK